jgi:hypothetical protein
MVVVATGVLEVPDQFSHHLKVSSGWVAHTTSQLLDDEPNLDALLGQVDATSNQ